MKSTIWINNIPEAEFEDEETEELLRANKILRDKVGQIADLVVSAISKAAALRKQITTHRDKPQDPELNSKLKEINKYQKAIMKMKYPKVVRNYRVKEMQDEIKILQADIEKLNEDKEVIQKENNKRQQAYKNIQKGNKDMDDKVQSLRDNLKEEKEYISKLDELKKQNEKEYLEAMDELRKYDDEYRSLFERKLEVKSGKQSNIESEYEAEEKHLAETQKKKVIKRIAENKVTHIRTKLNAEKKKNTQLEKELEEIKKTIQDKQDQNEQMSKRAKELKGMIVMRQSSGVQSHVKTPISPKLSEDEKGELRV